MEPVTHVYETLSEAVNDLEKRGYTVDLSLFAERHVLRNAGETIELNPGRFRIDEIHRFEGNTDPGDETIVFAVSSADNTIKGLIVDAFGAYASSASILAGHLPAHHDKKNRHGYK